MAEVGEAASGSTVQLRVGEAAAVVLPEHPTTGFRWVFEIGTAAVASVDGSQFRARSSKPGAGGERVFTVSALQPGTTVITWKRWRAWEGEASVDRRFSLTFVVS